jgi:glycosyltransferase involved in cell wall biosynthesis
MRPGITVVIPTFPARAELLARAIQSVQAQTLPAQGIIVSTDNAGLGAPATRHRGLQSVQTEWTAFLDDDDEFKPTHLEHLATCAEDTEADLVFSWFDVVNGTDPFPENFGRQFDVDHPHQITITTLVRTEAALDAGGFLVDADGYGVDTEGNRTGEDFWFSVRMAGKGYRIVHLPERTWRWHHDSGNTSGLAARRKDGPGPFPTASPRLVGWVS